MEKITINSTKETPEIRFDGKEGVLQIKGRSIAANPLEFYKPLLSSLEQYVVKPATVTKVNIHMEYFNTSSSRCILNVLKHLASLHQNGKTVQINWLYEDGDENMRDVGVDYAAIVNLPFEMQEVPAE